MSAARKARRALRKQKAQFIRLDADGQAMLIHAAAWLSPQAIGAPSARRLDRKFRTRFPISITD